MNLEPKLRMVEKDTSGEVITVTYFKGNEAIPSRVTFCSADGESTISIGKRELAKIIFRLLRVW